jgi:hypothetical protein
MKTYDYLSSGDTRRNKFPRRFHRTRAGKISRPSSGAEGGQVSAVRQDFNPRTILATVGAAQFCSGLHRDVLNGVVDGPALFDNYKWVWNVAADPEGEIKCLRFWSRELIAPQTVKGWNLDRVIKSILPPGRKQYHSGYVETTLLSISGPLLMDLRPQLNGQLAANSSFFTRQGLEKFLRARWLGAERTEGVLR